MILTDKCKEEFLKWLNYDLFNYNYRLDKTMQQSKIIEFFDSVGIFISVKKVINIHWMYDILGHHISVFEEMQESRSEATQIAILKANEIFNNLNK